MLNIILQIQNIIFPPQGEQLPYYAYGAGAIVVLLLFKLVWPLPKKIDWIYAGLVLVLAGSAIAIFILSPRLEILGPRFDQNRPDMAMPLAYLLFFGPIALSAFIPRRWLLPWCIVLAISLSINSFLAYQLWLVKDADEGSVVREANLFNHNAAVYPVWFAMVAVMLRLALRGLMGPKPAAAVQSDEDAL